LDAFSGSVAPTRTGLPYKVGLVVVTFMMVLLPLAYMGVIAATAWGVVWYLRHATWLFERGGLLHLLLYLGPAAAGGILVFFMVKPFFARQTKGPAPITLDPAQEPLLFAFVNKICALVGAPAPGRIDADCQVNASASLSRGVWSRDLVLTIGLPLASGLDMRQFAGVLAHEFGHFAQGAGMRLTYVIRHINHWFARVVYERDEWDVKLAQAARGADLRIGWILHAARACVWLTRRILWALMHAGNAISCFMLRQMEYDADSYEAKVAGSDAFSSTAGRLRVLNAATQLAYGDVRQSWASRRLPENLPLLIDHKATSLPAEIHQKISSAETETRTGWFDTHPCDADRVAAVRRLNVPGVFLRQEPATNLFADFPRLSREVTRHQFEKHLELEFTDENLMPAEEILRESTASAEADAMVQKFYGDVETTLQPLLLSGQLPPLADEVHARAQWAEAGRAMESHREAAGKTSAECLEQYRRLADFVTAHRLASAGFVLEPNAFGLPTTASSAGAQESAARLAIEECRTTIADQMRRLDPFVGALRQRVSLALQRALALGQTSANEAATAPAPDSAPTNEAPTHGRPVPKAPELIRLLAALGDTMASVRELGSKVGAFACLANNRPNHSQPDDVTREMAEVVSELQRAVATLQTRLRDFPYPFAHARGQLTVAEYACSETPSDNDWHRAYLDADAHVQRLFALHYRLIGRVLALADASEREWTASPSTSESNPGVSRTP
jgi:Zn-dependent protease with chaperone function